MLVGKFTTLSNGIALEKPKPIKKTERKIKMLQRRLARKRKGFKNRMK